MCINWGNLTQRISKFLMVYNNAGCYSPNSFLYYIVDLSQDFLMCKSGCYINEQYMNHVMYADDICLLVPNAIDLQQMLDMCVNFSIRNYIMFNLIKSVCVVFKPKSNKLYGLTVRLDCDILEYTAHTKY